MKCGQCVCCEEWFKVRPDGNVRIHGTMSRGLCTGSDRPPVVDW